MLPEKIFYVRILESLPISYCVVGFAALIESDAEGIGGSGFVECIREHIHSVSKFYLANIYNYLFLCYIYISGTMKLMLDLFIRVGSVSSPKNSLLQ